MPHGTIPTDVDNYRLFYAIMTHKKLDINWDEVASILPEELTGRNARRRWDALKKRLEKGKVLEPSMPSRNGSPSRKKSTRKAPKGKKVKKQAQKEAEEDDQKRECAISRSQSASEERSAAEVEMQKTGKRKADAMRRGSMSVKLSKEDKINFDHSDQDGSETPAVVTGRSRKIAKTDVTGKGKEQEDDFRDETLLGEGQVYEDEDEDEEDEYEDEIDVA